MAAWAVGREVGNVFLLLLASLGAPDVGVHLAPLDSLRDPLGAPWAPGDTLGSFLGFS